MPDLVPQATAERRDLLELLRDLAPREWELPSLCRGWTVRDVVAHVYSYDERSWAATAALFLRGGMRPSRVNDAALRDYRDRTPAELVDLAAACAVPRGLPAGLGAGIALTDGLIHHQDLRRPLGRPRDVPADRLQPALDIAMTAPTLPTRRLVRGLRLRATDLAWSHGTGPEVAGPAEALLVAAAGRRHALAELDGAGAATLASRLP